MLILDHRHDLADAAGAAIGAGLERLAMLPPEAALAELVQLRDAVERIIASVEHELGGATH